MMEAAARLERAQKDLLLHWRRTREVWRDGRSEQVERELLEPLEAATKQAGESVARLAAAARTAERECSEV